MLSKDQMVLIVRFWNTTKSVKGVQRMWYQHFGLDGRDRRAAPDYRAIKRIVEI